MTRNNKTRRLRNIGIAAHIDAGKTTLTERILYYAGAIHHCGDVHNGDTTTDFDPIEKKKGITISAAAVPCEWTPGAHSLFAGEAHRLNIIDTPGHVDFTAEVERSLRVLDGAIAVFCGVAGVQPQSETVWRQANRYGVPRIAFVNKMDRTGANFARVIRDLREKLGANAWPVLLPWGAEDALIGQLDVVEGRALRFNGKDGFSVEEVPPDLAESVRVAREELVSALASCDDTTAASWLEGRNVTAAELRAAIRRQTIALRFVPAIGGSAYKHVGVQSLLDAVADYLPAPGDLPPARTHDGTAIAHDDKAPLVALAFKSVNDRLSGRLVFVRVYAGTLRRGDTLLNPRTGKTDRAGRLVRVIAQRREDIDEAPAGEICAVLGLRGFSTGDTLCDAGHVVMLEPPQFPQPVVSMAIEPRSRADAERLAEALARVSDEDPTFRTFTHAETGQCIIAGMGELHLGVIREKLETQQGVETTAGAPEIAYRETVTATAEADHLLKKQNGGVGMYARVKLGVRPGERGSGIVIENSVRGGAIPAEFLNAVKRGIEETAAGGIVNGYPLVDAHVEILDGASHAKDSSDLAFRLAGGEALREAVRSAAPVLLEPVMRVEVEVPGEHQGDILGDLNRRRARVLGMDGHGNLAAVQAAAPLAELFGYTDAIRSLSRGRASATMTPSHFDLVPSSVAELVLKK